MSRIYAILAMVSADLLVDQPLKTNICLSVVQRAATTTILPTMGVPVGHLEDRLKETIQGEIIHLKNIQGMLRGRSKSTIRPGDLQDRAQNIIQIDLSEILHISGVHCIQTIHLAANVILLFGL